MPISTLDELLKCNKKCYDLSNDLIESLFNIIDGIPRKIFSESHNNNKNRCFDKEIYDKFTKDMIKSIERTNFKQVFDLEKTFSHPK